MFQMVQFLPIYLIHTVLTKTVIVHGNRYSNSDLATLTIETTARGPWRNTSVLRVEGFPVL